MLDIIVVVFIYEGKGKVGVVVDNFFRLDKKKKITFSVVLTKIKSSLLNRKDEDRKKNV